MITATKTQAEDDTEEDAAASRTPFEVEMFFFVTRKRKTKLTRFLDHHSHLFGFFLLFRSLDQKLDGRMGHGTLSNHYCVAHTIR